MSGAADRARRVAIIGAGPRGVFALESLCAHPGREVEVTIYGAHGDDGSFVAGQGSAYARDQPEYMQLNAAGVIVDVWRHRRADAGEPFQVARALPDAEGGEDEGAFRAWATGPSAQPGAFPPRREVGEYLGWAYERVLADARARGVHVRSAGPARELTRATDGGRWRVRCDDGEQVVDEVLLVLGHATTSPTALDAGDLSEAARAAGVKVIPAVYPASLLDDIPAGGVLAVRGAALSFIDAALTVTVGRGGRMRRRGDNRFTYEPCGREPAHVLPLALDGRFLPAKAPGSLLLQRVGAADLERARTRVHDASSPDAVIDAVAELASCALRNTEGTAHAASEEVERVLDAPEPGVGRAREELERSIDVASGRARPGAIALTGLAWTYLYDDVVARLSGTVWPEEQWQRWRRLQTTLDRLAFGPPPENAARLLALLDAGVVATAWLDTGVGVEEMPAVFQGRPVSAIADAVLAPAGLWPGAYDVLASIENELGAWSRHFDNGPSEGVRIGADASVLDGQGEPIAGLAAFGRMCEDWVVGTDTLNRALHPYLEAWAARVRS